MQRDDRLRKIMIDLLKVCRVQNSGKLIISLLKRKQFNFYSFFEYFKRLSIIIEEEKYNSGPCLQLPAISFDNPQPNRET